MEKKLRLRKEIVALFLVAIFFIPVLVFAQDDECDFHCFDILADMQEREQKKEEPQDDYYDFDWFDPRYKWTEKECDALRQDQQKSINKMRKVETRECLKLPVKDQKDCLDLLQKDINAILGLIQADQADCYKHTLTQSGITSETDLPEKSGLWTDDTLIDMDSFSHEEMFDEETFDACLKAEQACMEGEDNSSDSDQDEPSHGEGESGLADPQQQCGPGEERNPLGVCDSVFPTVDVEYVDVCHRGPDDGCIPNVEVPIESVSVEGIYGEWIVSCPPGEKPNPADGGCIFSPSHTDDWGMVCEDHTGRCCERGETPGPNDECVPVVEDPRKLTDLGYSSVQLIPTLASYELITWLETSLNITITSTPVGRIWGPNVILDSEPVLLFTPSSTIDDVIFYTLEDEFNTFNNFNYFTSPNSLMNGVFDGVQ